jgi:hypothetical protein
MSDGCSEAYDAERHILYLHFRSGDVYRYFDFPEDEYGVFLNTESQGRYFLDHIRDSFPYERLAKLWTA